MHKLFIRFHDNIFIKAIMVSCYYFAVLGVIRFSASSNSSSLTFPESLHELQNTSFSRAINAQISIPSSLLIERKAKGGILYLV